MIMEGNATRFNSTDMSNSTESFNFTEFFIKEEHLNLSNAFDSSEYSNKNLNQSLNLVNSFNITEVLVPNTDQDMEQLVSNSTENEILSSNQNTNKTDTPLNSTNLKFTIEGSKLQLPSNKFRSYRYIKLKNELEVLLMFDTYDTELNVGIQYPIYLLDNCKELGGYVLLSNVLINGLKEYFNDVALLKHSSINGDYVALHFSTTEDQYLFFDYFSRLFVNFDISFDAFKHSYLNTLEQFTIYKNTYYTKVKDELIQLAHNNTYLKSSCPLFSNFSPEKLKSDFQLIQIKKKIVDSIRNNISSNLLTLIVTAPTQLDLTQSSILSTLGSMKNLDKKLPNISYETDTNPAFTQDNLLGKKLIILNDNEYREFFFCFNIEDDFSSNISDIEKILRYIFIEMDDSFTTKMSEQNLGNLSDIRMIYSNKSPILFFYVVAPIYLGVQPADILALIRQTTYTYAESQSLKSHVLNYFQSKKLKYMNLLSTSSSDEVISNLLTSTSNSLLDHISNINSSEDLVESIVTILGSSTFDNFFLVETYLSEPLTEGPNNYVIDLDLEFWNSLNKDLIPSLSLKEPQINEFLPKVLDNKIIEDQYYGGFEEINFNNGNTSLLDPYHDRISFTLGNGFIRPSSSIYFKMNILQNEYFSLKSILFKCFIAFVMSTFLAEYTYKFRISSVDLQVNCPFDTQHFYNKELGEDSLDLYMSSHSQVFPELLNLVSESFNNATSLNEKEFCNLRKSYRNLIIHQNDFYDDLFYARLIVDAMIDTDYPSYYNYLSAIDHSSFQDYINYCNSIISFNKIKGLISGNINLSDSRILLSKFIHSLKLGALEELKDPYEYNLPKLIVCYQPNMPHHYLLKRERTNKNRNSNLILASVILEDSIKNMLILQLLKYSMLELMNLAIKDKVHLDFKWHIRKYYIQLDITSLSQIRLTSSGENLPIAEYTTEILREIYNLQTDAPIKWKQILKNAKNVIFNQTKNTKTRFEQFYYSYMKEKIPYSEQNLINELQNLTSEDIVKFVEEFKRSLTYLIIVSSQNQTVKETENQISGFTFTNGYPNID